MRDQSFTIGIQGNYGRGLAPTAAVPFGQGFRGAAKRIARVKEAIGDFLFDFEDGEDTAVSAFYQDGIVMLSGQVDSEETRRSLINGVRKIPGVTGVRNALTLNKSKAPGPTTRRSPDVEV